MHGVTFRYISLGAAQYRRVLRKKGCNLLEQFYDDADNYYYVAEKTG